MNILTIILLILGLAFLWWANKILPDPDSFRDKISYYYTTFEERQKFEEMQDRKENGELLFDMAITLLVLSIVSAFIKIY